MNSFKSNIFSSNRNTSSRDYNEPITSEATSQYRPNIPPIPSVPSVSSSFSLKNIALIVLVVLILAFLGFNIFKYLSEGTDYLADLLGPLGINITRKSGDIAKETTSTALTGTKKLLDVGSDTASNILDTAKTGTNSGINFIQDRLDKEYERKQSKKRGNNNRDEQESEPEPVSSNSFKQGFCFIGKINDVRYCAKVNESSQCMSGEIYSTENACVNA